MFRLGQRVSVQDIGFGTVVDITPEWEVVRVELDGDVSYWFDFSQVEQDTSESVWVELQAVPSYCEAQADAFAKEQAEGAKDE